MIAKHVDDIKVTGEVQEVEKLMKELEHVFGKLTVNRNEFTNCGIRHKKHKDGKITLDQDEHIGALIPITHPELIGVSPDTKASEQLVSLYRSLLGAVAYTQLTQHQVACYVVALQRVANRLTIGDIRKLNVLTRKLQKQPRTIVFQPLPLEKQEYLTVFSDAGFKKEELDGYALRGALHIRHTRPIYLDNGQPNKEPTPCHILLAESRSIKTVRRSTYAAELLSAEAAATDSSLPLVVTLHEVLTGPLGTEQLKLEQGNINYHFHYFGCEIGS